MPKLTSEDPRKRSAPLEAYDEVYHAYAENGKRRKVSPDYDFYSLALQNLGQAAQALSQSQQQLKEEQAQTVQALAENQKLRNEFEDQKTKADQKYNEEMQWFRSFVSQLEQAVESEKQRTEAVQQQLDDLKATSSAEIGKMERKYQEVVAQAEIMLSQAHGEASSACEERDSALARLDMQEHSRPDVEMEETGRPDSIQVVSDEASAQIAGLSDQLSAKEIENASQAARIKQLEQLLACAGGDISSQHQPAASMPSPPEEEATAPGYTATEFVRTPTPSAPRRGAKNPLSRAERDALPMSRGGGANASGVAKSGGHARMYGTTSNRPAPVAYGRAEASKGRKTAMLDSHVSNISSSKMFNQTKLEKDLVDPYENEFHGKGFDAFEARKIVVDYVMEFEYRTPHEDACGEQVWDAEDDVEYYAYRGPNRDPVCITLYSCDFDFMGEATDGMQHEYILPLSQNLDELDRQQKCQYVQACIIAKLPETQTEAARAFLKVDEFKAFEKRMFKGPKPIGQCNEELEYPKMFKKIVKYLRSSWSFRDSAQRWAAGEDAGGDNKKPSCWPPMYENRQASFTTIYKTRDAWEKDIEKSYKLDETMKNDLDNANLDEAIRLFDGQPKEAPSEDRQKRNLPSERGIGSMLSL